MRSSGNRRATGGLTRRATITGSVETTSLAIFAADEAHVIFNSNENRSSDDGQRNVLSLSRFTDANGFTHDAGKSDCGEPVVGCRAEEAPPETSWQ